MSVILCVSLSSCNAPIHIKRKVVYHTHKHRSILDLHLFNADRFALQILRSLTVLNRSRVKMDLC